MSTSSPVAVALRAAAAEADEFCHLNKFISVKTRDDMSCSTRDFSDLSDPHQLRLICCREIPSWRAVGISPDDVQVEQMMEGLTNQLFKCFLPADTCPGLSPHKVLFRVYGTTVSDLYDTNFELKVFRTLSEYEAAPKLIAAFRGGRIEEWVNGDPLKNAKMTNPSILCAIATVLSKFHHVDQRAPEIRSWYTGNSSVETNLDRWARRACEIYHRIDSSIDRASPSPAKLARLESPSPVADENGRGPGNNAPPFTRFRSMNEDEARVWHNRMLTMPVRGMLDVFANPPYGKGLEVNLEELVTQPHLISSAKFLEWLLHDLPADHPLLQLRFCHNDVQENNIMVTGTRLRLIDFEYAGYSYPAYDVANFFTESTMDYCVEEPPFFHHSVAPEHFPSDEHIKLFASVYLSEGLQSAVLPSHPGIDLFVKIVKRFVLASHLTWTFWSIIRAPQAGTNCEFDFVGYAKSRFSAFEQWRDHLIKKKLI